MRNSFIFYKSFYDSIKELDIEYQVEIYNAIFEYQFEGIEPELTGVSKSIFALIIPQLEANNKRYENGKKGGRPKNQKETEKKPKENQKETKVKANDNVNVNVNENDNDNVNVNVDNIYSYIEENFGRTLSPIEYEEVKQWEDNELTRYAIKLAVLNGAYSIKYISKILYNWEKENIKTVQQVKYKENKIKDLPEWFDKEIEIKPCTKLEQEELNNILKELGG